MMLCIFLTHFLFWLIYPSEFTWPPQPQEVIEHSAQNGLIKKKFIDFKLVQVMPLKNLFSFYIAVCRPHAP